MRSPAITVLVFFSIIKELTLTLPSLISSQAVFLEQEHKDATTESNLGEETVSLNGISVPADGNATIVYEVSTNRYAPLETGAEITNTVTLSGGITPVTAEETVTAESEPELSVTKSVSPVPVAENGTLTYTFVIQNTGNTPATADDLAVMTDTFSPVLSNLAVTVNGETWTEPADYTYDGTTGAFSSVAGVITVPAATFAQDPATGVWVTTPGVSILTITGTV